MTIKKIVQISALTILLAAGGAAAQTAGSVNVSATPLTTSVSPGTNVNLGTITLTGVQGGGAVNSLPITITPSNGGIASNLSNCQIYNSNGNSLTTGSNAINSIGTGANTFMFNSPLSVPNGTTTLTVRCDVATATPGGAIFTIGAGAASLGPVLRVNLDTAPSVPAGSNDVALANIAVGSTGANFNVSAIPLTITAGSNGSVANLTDCKLRDATNLDGSLTNAFSIVNGSATTFTLATPYMIPAGTSKMFSLTCDVQPATAVGSTFTISVTPGNVTATNAATGAAVTPVGVPAGGTGPNGLPASTSGTVIVSAAGSAPTQPGSSTGGSTGGTTPGVPNTGVESQLGLLSLITLAGVIALFGAFYLGRKRV